MKPSGRDAQEAKDAQEVEDKRKAAGCAMNQSLEDVFLPSFAVPAPDPFVKSLDRVRKIYEDTGAVLEVDRQKNREERKHSRKKNRDEYEEWEHWVYDEREEDLDECERLRGQFAIVFLDRSIRDFMQEVKSEFELPSARRLRHRGKLKNGRDHAFLERCSSAFSERGVDVTSRPEWSCIRDVINARDAVMHPEKQRSSRYLDGQGEIHLTSKDFEALLDELRQFSDWLRGEVRAHPAGGAR